MVKQSLRTLLLAGVAVPTLALPAASGAVAAPAIEPAAPIIEEIIVTARKKDEDASDAPVAVSAFTAEDIEDAGIVDLQDLALQTPGFSYREGFGRLFSEGNNRPVIRGMSSVLGEANAGYFIDGVYIAGPISGYDLENLERVEVVRGPQSALYGRGAFGGAVNFVTRRPDGQTKGRIKATAGSRWLTSADGFFTTALSDTVSGEVNARYYRRGSQYDNTATGEKDLGGQESYRIGGKLNMDVGDNLNLYIQGGYARDKDEGYAYAQWNGGEARENGISDDQSNCFAPSVYMSLFGMNFTQTQSRGYYCGEIGQPDTYYSDYAGLNSVDRDTFNVIADISYRFDNGATLTSLTGYTYVDYSQAEVPAVYPGGSVVYEDGSQTYYSEEIRYASPQDDRLRYLIGAYYLRSDVGDTVNVSFNNLTGSLADEDLTKLENGTYLENKAVFASVDYDVTDALMVTAEVRYQDEKKVLAGALYDMDNSVSFDAVLPRFAVTYDLGEALTLYGNIAKGNKPGGFNDDFYTVALDDEDQAYWRDLGRGTYDESTVWSYETGAKADFGDAGSLNAAVFYLDWSGQQLTQSDALRRAGSSRQTTVTFITNAGKSEVKGFEVDGNWNITDSFEIRAAYAYSKATFKDYIDENWRDLNDTNGWYTGQAVAGVIFPDADEDGSPDVNGAPALLPDGVILDPDKAPTNSDGDGVPDRFFVVDTADPDGQVRGNSLPQTPRHQLSVSATYSEEIKDGYTVFARADYLYESKRYVQAANLAWMGDTHKVNLRTGITADDWTLTLWIDNLFKEDTPEVVTRYVDFQNVLMIPSQVRSGSRYTFARDFTVTAPALRTMGITFSKNF